MSALVVRVFAALSVVALARPAFSQAVTDDPRRPPPLQAPPECQLYRGSARGNDPTQLVELVLCVDGSSVRGTFQTSSLNSGWSKRSFVGSVIEPDVRLALRETAFLERRSNPGWRFCLIDRYDLRFTTRTHIESDYHSTDCRDDGHISVDLVGALDAGVSDGGALEPPPREQPRVVITPPDLQSVHTRRRGLFERVSCATSPTAARDAGRRELLAFVCAAGVALVLRRSRLDRRRAPIDRKTVGS
ncbi:MAG: hypothetical protein JNK05_30085 [Myxococcales bacterium]|nr:hypothetical protein [Myxococcales bacterium]